MARMYQGESDAKEERARSLNLLRWEGNASASVRDHGIVCIPLLLFVWNLLKFVFLRIWFRKEESAKFLSDWIWIDSREKFLPTRLPGPLELDCVSVTHWQSFWWFLSTLSPRIFNGMSWNRVSEYLGRTAPFKVPVHKYFSTLKKSDFFTLLGNL